MEYAVKKTDNKVYIELKGDIDIVNASNFKNTCMEIIAEEKKDVVFDCSHLDFIDSTALGSMVIVNKYADSLGLNVKLVNAKERIKKLFSITALDTVITIE